MAKQKQKRTLEPLAIVVRRQILEEQHRVWVDGVVRVWRIASLTRLWLLSEDAISIRVPHIALIYMP